ncbi:MAG TPA: hydroxyacid-oxoacid transhydrogenase [Polyangium sp.]|nr:hydroxyacid-oxoacid transhydrogenase [Polyangium sp.]
MRRMRCCLGFSIGDSGDAAFSVDMSAVTFGAGAIREVGGEMRALGGSRVALFTDTRLGRLSFVNDAQEALVEAGCDVVIYDRVLVEPTDGSFRDAAAFARDGRFDGYVSVGGGSVIDTCKAALLFATYPAEINDFVTPPLGRGRAIPGPLPVHIACPTTTGTGSECTGIAVFDDTQHKAKTGIASRLLRPTRAIVDPNATRTLPSSVVAASGFDVISHALESYTARSFGSRSKATNSQTRPMSQGANPWSDMGCVKALELAGKYFLRAVKDANDAEAREGMAWAATLAGIAFGNAGVHMPHAMSYAVAGLHHAFQMPGYPEDKPLVPHGVAVIVNAPAVFRAFGGTNPDRHLECAKLLGADIRGAWRDDAGDLLAGQVCRMMQAAGMPNGVGAVGYSSEDIDALTAGTMAQTRLTSNAPKNIDDNVVISLFRAALSYW